MCHQPTNQLKKQSKKLNNKPTYKMTIQPIKLYNQTVTTQQYNTTTNQLDN